MDPEHLEWIRRHNDKVHQDREMERKSWKDEPYVIEWERKRSVKSGWGKGVCVCGGGGGGGGGEGREWRI